MHNTKLIQILKKFSDEEWKDYEKLVDSPFHNKGRNYTPLLRELRKFRPDFSNLKLTNEHLYSVIFKGKPYNSSTFKSMTSGLVRLAEEYLILNGFEKNGRLRNVLLLKELRLKNLYGMYDSLLRNTEQDYSFDGNIDIDFFHDIISYESEKGRGYAQRSDYGNYYKSNVTETNAEIAGALLTIFETVQNEKDMKVSYGFDVPNSLVIEIEKVINFDILLKNLEKSNNRYYEIIALHYYLYKAFKEPNNYSSYYKCRDFLFSNYALYTKKQLFNLFILLESFCISNIGSKNTRNDEMMKLYRFMFDNEIYSYTEEGYIPHLLFRNVIFSTGLHMIEWTESFVTKQLPRVEPGSRDSMKFLWEAQRCFLLGDFQGVLKHAHKINFDLLFLKMDVKQLYLIAYYELGYFEEARSMTDTFTKYLKHNEEVAKTLRDRHLNFIAVYNNLLKLKESGGMNNSYGLKEEINSSKNIVKKLWLLEKLEELEQQNAG